MLKARWSTANSDAGRELSGGSHGCPRGLANVMCRQRYVLPEKRRVQVVEKELLD